MNKPLSLISGILILTGIATAYAQDTNKRIQKAAIPAIKPAIKPVNGTYQPKAYQIPPAQPVIVDNSLNGQYNAILKNTYRYQQGPIISFHKSYMDTLNAEKRKLKEASSKLIAQAKTIAELQSSITSKDQTLSESQSKVDSVSLLGMRLSKSAYNVMMWGLVLILGGALLIVIFLTGSSRREAAHRTQLYEDLSAEFAAYKAKANEKEKKLARELQTERNKLDELLGR